MCLEVGSGSGGGGGPRMVVVWVQVNLVTMVVCFTRSFSLSGGSFAGVCEVIVMLNVDAKEIFEDI